MGSILSFLSGWQGYLIGGAALLLVGVGGGAYVEHRMDLATINAMKLADQTAQTEAVSAEAKFVKNQDDIAMKAAVDEAASQQKIVTEYVKVQEKVPVYVTQAQENKSCLTVGLMRLLYAASSQTDPDSITLAPGQSDDDCSDVAESAVAGWFSAFAEPAFQNAEQLNSLEKSVTDLHNAAPTGN